MAGSGWGRIKERNSLPRVRGSLDQPVRSMVILSESVLLLGAQFLNLLPLLGVRHFISDTRPRVLYGVK